MNNINGKDLSRFVGNGEEAEEMRSRQHYLKLSNVQIIQIAYICMEMIQKCIEYNMKLFFEQANGYHACFHLLRRLLKVVDQEYLAVHHYVAEFYKEGRELSTDWDRLSFYDVPASKQATETVTNPVSQALEMQENINPAKLRRKIEKAVRRHLISKLTDKRAKMVPMFEYSSDGSYEKDNDLGLVDVINADITFEPGDSDTLVRVLVRPDMPKSALIEILYAIIEEVSDHEGEDWMAELAEAVAMVAAQLKAHSKTL